MWILVLVMLVIAFLLSPNPKPPARLAPSMVMVFVDNPSTELLDDLNVSGVVVVSKLPDHIIRQRFDMGQTIRRERIGFEPYAMIVDGSCRLKHGWMSKSLVSLRSAHLANFSCVTQLPDLAGPTFPHMTKSGKYRPRRFVFPGRVYQSEVVSPRFIFGTTPVMLKFVGVKNPTKATMCAVNNGLLACNAIDFIIVGKPHTEAFGVRHDMTKIEHLDKYGRTK